MEKFNIVECSILSFIVFNIKESKNEKLKKGGQMYSVELTIIIPIIIILILTMLMMFLFATELAQYELNHSRVFMMSLTLPSAIDNQVVREEVKAQFISRHYSISVFQTAFYNPKELANNRFNNLNHKNFFKFDFNFQLTQVNRKWIAIIKKGVETFYRE